MKSKLIGKSIRLVCALRTGLFLLAFFFAARLCPAYSVLTHEEIVDLLPIHTKKNKKAWTATLANLEKLKAAQPVPE